jgi:hypothetical protein
MWDPYIGRWISPDPAHQFASPYLGMGNNPMNGVDPDGRRIIDNLSNSDCGIIRGVFQTFAGSNIGHFLLKGFAEAGQEIAGRTFKKDGIFHKSKIDLSFGIKERTEGGDGSSAWTQTLLPEENNGRWQINVFLNYKIGEDNVNPLGNAFYSTKALLHEFTIHAIPNARRIQDKTFRNAYNNGINGVKLGEWQHKQAYNKNSDYNRFVFTYLKTINRNWRLGKTDDMISKEMFNFQITYH